MYLLVDTPPDRGQKPLEALWKEDIAADSWPTKVLQILIERS